MEKIGKRIKYLREEKGLTQVQLAKLLYVDKSTIAKYENGAIQPSARMIVVFANFFNVTSDYLLGLQDD